jgi:predicted small secreted protein
MRVVLILSVLLLSACNTYQAARGNTTGSKVAGGVKQDAAVAGKTIERAAGEIGDALNKTFK